MYWRRVWTWREKLEMLKRQLRSAQILRDQLLASELRRSLILPVFKRVPYRQHFLAQHLAARALQAAARTRLTLRAAAAAYCGNAAGSLPPASFTACVS